MIETEKIKREEIEKMIRDFNVDMFGEDYIKESEKKLAVVQDNEELK